jgi:opacity protein-like surface antigen
VLKGKHAAVVTKSGDAVRPHRVTYAAACDPKVTVDEIPVPSPVLMTRLFGRKIIVASGQRNLSASQRFVAFGAARRQRAGRWSAGDARPARHWLGATMNAKQALLAGIGALVLANFPVSGALAQSNGLSNELNQAIDRWDQHPDDSSAQENFEAVCRRVTAELRLHGGDMESGEWRSMQGKCAQARKRHEKPPKKKTSVAPLVNPPQTGGIDTGPKNPPPLPPPPPATQLPAPPTIPNITVPKCFNSEAERQALLQKIRDAAWAVSQYMNQLWDIMNATSKGAFSAFSGDPRAAAAYQAALKEHQKLDQEYEAAQKAPLCGAGQTGMAPGGTWGGFYVAVGIGGGGSKPTADSDLSGSGSGFAAGGSAGYRMRFDHDKWMSFDFGADWPAKDETFDPPVEDMKVRTGPIFHQSIQLGINIPSGTPGQWFAPYVAIGVAEADIKVSTPTLSDQRWNMAPLIGGGIDYRLTPNWLIHSNVSTYMFDRHYQFSGGTPFEVNERVTTGTIGLIYQFGSQ